VKHECKQGRNGGEKEAREVEVEATYPGVPGLCGAILLLFHYLGERLVVWMLEGRKRKRKKGDKREKSANPIAFYTWHRLNSLPHCLGLCE